MTKAKKAASVLNGSSKSNLPPKPKIETAEEVLKRIFSDSEGTSSIVGAEIANLSAKHASLQKITFPKPYQTRLIAVANQKGGVGKTTTTVNLACALADNGARVLVVDMDPQGNASTALGFDRQSSALTIYDVLEGRKNIEEVKMTCKYFPTLDVVPASIDLSGAELEVANMPDRNHLLKNALTSFFAESPIHYDYVFVDCPPSLGLLVLNAMCAVHEVLIPVQAEYYALEGLKQLLHTISLVQENYNRELIVSTMLITMFDKRTLLSQEVYEEVHNHYPNILLKSTIPRSVKISEAPSFAQSVISYDPKGAGAISYCEAALEIAQQSQNVLEGIKQRHSSTESE